MISPVVAALAALWITLLSGRVSRERIVNRISLGDGENKSVRNAVRAHGNAVENVILFVLLLLCFELVEGGREEAVIVASIYGAGRVAHAAGMLFWKLPMKSQLRRGGATITLAVHIWLALRILQIALT